MKFISAILLMILTLAQAAPMKLSTESQTVVSSTLDIQDKNMQLQGIYNQQTMMNRGNPIMTLQMLKDNQSSKTSSPPAPSPNDAIVPDTPAKTMAPEADEMTKWNNRMEQGGILAGIIGVGETAVNVIAKIIPDNFKNTVIETVSDVTVTTITPVTNIVKHTISVSR